MLSREQLPVGSGFDERICWEGSTERVHVGLLVDALPSSKVKQDPFIPLNVTTRTEVNRLLLLSPKIGMCSKFVGFTTIASTGNFLGHSITRQQN